LVGNGVPYSYVNGLTLSRFMLGTAQLGLSGYGINNTNLNVNAQALLGLCERSGVNCFDTAYEYGDAELKLGDYFKEKQTPPFIVSKLKIDMDLTSELEIERKIYAKTEAILTRLQLNTIPALMVHNPDMVEKYGDSITIVLRKMRNEGLIRRGGISFGAEPVAQYDAISGRTKDDIYEVVQIPMNLFDRRLLHCGALQDFSECGKIVVVRSVFLQGLFFMNEEALTGHLRADAGGLIKQLGAFAESERLSIAQLAISYIRDMAGIHCLVIGAENERQIDDIVEWMNGPELTDEIRERIERAFADVPARLISPGMWNRIS
jgi:aryl-alcohol dehydrogenase-like predicted oxidoreductase